MRKYSLNVILFLFLAVNSIGQSIDLNFTAVLNTSHIQMDSIRVTNRTHNCDTLLIWPDTVLTLYYVGVDEKNEMGTDFKVYQNFPNPVIDKTNICLSIPEMDEVEMIITDMSGSIVHKSNTILAEGKHSFTYEPGGGNIYFFTAVWRGLSRHIKIMVNKGDLNRSNTLSYSGRSTSRNLQKTTSNTQNFVFEPGDKLLYVGIISGIESGLTDTPIESKQYAFQYSANIPCPGLPTITYEGKVYNTIQIFSQCWLKENLDVGERIDGDVWMSDNGIIEKYCYDDNPDSCEKYGGLYQWLEVMQYDIQNEGSQGICPPGWHIPTEEEWKILEGSVDSEFGIGDNEWFIFQFRGFDAGKNLRSSSGWINNWNGIDKYGWTALGAGYLWDNGYQFLYVGEDAWWWTSSSPPTPWIRRMNPYGNGVYRHIKGSNNGLSVRCLKDL